MRKKRRLGKGQASFIALLIVLGFAGGPACPQTHHPSANSGETEVREAGTVTLDDLMRAAREHNPAIQASMHAARARKERIPAVRTLPDPTFSLQSMGDIIPGQLQSGDPSSARTIGVEQEIPFPGKLDLKGQMAEVEAEVEELNHARIQRQVMSELKQAYYDLFVIRKSMEIVRENKRLLRHFEEIAEKKYQVGQGIQQDVLKAQVEVSKLIDRLEVLDQRRVIAETLLNTLLYRPSETPLGKPAEFSKAELRHSLEELMKMAQANSTEVKVREREIASSQLSVRLAEKEYYPDFSVGFTYYDREPLPEMYAWMVKVKAPLYFWRKQRLELQSAESGLLSARKMRESTQSTIQYQVRQSYVMAATSDRLVRLYGKAIVPQANLSLESSVANYQVGKTDFLNLIDSLTAVLEFQLKYYESLGDFQKALAQMEPFVGIELTK